MLKLFSCTSRCLLLRKCWTAPLHIFDETTGIWLHARELDHALVVLRWFSPWSLRDWRLTVCVDTLAFSFLPFLLLLVSEDLFFGLVEVPAEPNHGREKLMWLRVLFVFTKIFKEFLELDFRVFHPISEE